MTEHEEDHSIDSPDGDQPKGHVARAFWHLAERGRCLSRHPQALWVVGLLSFLESTILPVAIEVVLLPYMLARRDIVWRIASATLLGCIVGACFGYAVGYFLFASLGQWVVDIMGWEAQLADTQAWFDSNGFWAVLAIGVTPVPFQLAMLTAGGYGVPNFDVPHRHLDRPRLALFRFGFVGGVIRPAGDAPMGASQDHGVIRNPGTCGCRHDRPDVTRWRRPGKITTDLERVGICRSWTAAFRASLRARKALGPLRPLLARRRYRKEAERCRSGLSFRHRPSPRSIGCHRLQHRSNGRCSVSLYG